MRPLTVRPLTLGLLTPGLLALLLGCGDAHTAAAQRQSVLVVAPDDSAATTGWLYAMEERGGVWSRRGEPVPVVFGWGGVGPKHEGDGRSPEGVFPLGTAFGYGSRPPPGLRLPWLALEPTTVCVDDAASSVYNRLVDAPEGGDRDFSSAEPMRRDLSHGDGLYEYGVVVGYNPEGERDPATGAGRGSCIFLHVWRGRTSPTAGCTAMPREALLDLLAWLDPAQEPFLAQGRRSYLTELASRGALPYAVPDA